jgi:hypothetical protein
MHTKFLVKKLKEGDHLVDLGMNERKILRWILQVFGMHLKDSGNGGLYMLIFWTLFIVLV